jgi:hypothetical protein
MYTRATIFNKGLVARRTFARPQDPVAMDNAVHSQLDRFVAPTAIVVNLETHVAMGVAVQMAVFAVRPGGAVRLEVHVVEAVSAVKRDRLVAVTDTVARNDGEFELR